MYLLLSCASRSLPWLNKRTGEDIRCCWVNKKSFTLLVIQATASRPCDSRPRRGRVTNMSRNHSEFYACSTPRRCPPKATQWPVLRWNFTCGSFSFCEFVIVHEGQKMRLKSKCLTVDVSYRISKPIQTPCRSIPRSINAALPGYIICGPRA
jgi:hypothetical protein